MLVILLPACLSPLLMGEGFSVSPHHPLCFSCPPFPNFSVSLLDVKTGYNTPSCVLKMDVCSLS